MDIINASLARHHQPIIFGLALVIVFFAASCTFHDVIPIATICSGAIITCMRPSETIHLLNRR